MQAAKRPTINPRNRQHGAVLVISLMVLLVLTLLGISSLDGSIMEEKMAANSQTSNLTFQKADSSIRQTFFVESQNPIGAFKNAQSGSTATYNDADYDLTAGTVMSVPDTQPLAAYCNHSSAGTFQRRSIEITGSANIGEIRSRHRQGYSICMMASGS